MSGGGDGSERIKGAGVGSYLSVRILELLKPRCGEGERERVVAEIPFSPRPERLRELSRDLRANAELLEQRALEYETSARAAVGLAESIETKISKLVIDIGDEVTDIIEAEGITKKELAEGIPLLLEALAAVAQGDAVRVVKGFAEGMREGRALASEYRALAEDLERCASRLRRVASMKRRLAEILDEMAEAFEGLRGTPGAGVTIVLKLTCEGVRVEAT